MSRLIYICSDKWSAHEMMLLIAHAYKPYFNPYKPSVIFVGHIANSACPYQTPQNAASDLGLHCLLTKSSFES